jgi:uncharacterized protein
VRVAGQLVVVTGASRGIGRATAIALAGDGARLALLARSAEVEHLAAELRAGGADVHAFRADVGDPEQVESTAAEIRHRLGSPTIVLNNAGAGRFLAVEETSAAEVATMIACPYFAAFFVTRAFLPEMLARQRGLIVTVNSPVSRLIWPGATAYAAARWALRGFTAGLRAELRGTGVGVLEVLPGKVGSSYFDHNPGSEERIPRIARMIRTLSPEDVAAAIVRGIERDRRTVVLPAMLRLFLLLHRLTPGIVEHLLTATGWRRPS